MIQREHDGVRWELQPDFAPWLEDVLKSDGEVVKRSPVKQVTVHCVKGQPFYIKRYLHSAVPLRSLKYLLKPTQAAQEWNLAAQLEARNIPIVRHVALGERRNGLGVQESILITQGFDGAEMSETPDVDPAAVLAFVERMHEQGVLQVDLHPANMLVHRVTRELRLVDLHGTVIKAQLTDAERAMNLAVLRGYLPIRVSPEIEGLSTNLRRERLHDRARRCLRHNRDFGPLELGGLKWQVRLDWVDENVREILKSPDRFLESRPKLLKAGRSATVGGGKGYVLKRYNLRRASRLVKDLFRRSPGVESFRKAYHLELVGIRTARGVATREVRCCRFLVKSYFLMEEISGAVSLEAHLKNGSMPAGCLESVVALVGCLHGNGLSHRDLKPSNLVFDREGQPHLIDLDGLAYVGEMPRTRVRADLERLARGIEQWVALPPREQRRLLRGYARSCRAVGR